MGRWLQNLTSPYTSTSKKAVRIISGAHYLAESSNLFKNLNLLTIYDLYILHLAIFMHRHHTHSLPSIFNAYFRTNASLHSYNTRSCHNLHMNACKTNTRQFTIRIAGPKLWNTIDLGLRSLTSLHSFKLAFKKYLLKNWLLTISFALNLTLPQCWFSLIMLYLLSYFHGDD